MWMEDKIRKLNVQDIKSWNQSTAGALAMMIKSIYLSCLAAL